jgi:hypothetical protein
MYGTTNIKGSGSTLYNSTLLQCRLGLKTTNTKFRSFDKAEPIIQVFGK